MAGHYSIHTNTCFGFFRIIISFLFLLFFAAIETHGQQRCGTAVYMEALRSKNVIQESDQQFEDWLRENLRPENRRKTTGRETALTYKVQVVVHVIHNGENVGLGLNISDAQIMSQLSVLNEDFNRQNADAVNTPVEFQPLAEGMNIEFILAQQTPEGLATNGINRIKGTRTLWSMETDEELKALSYWDANHYLNIWVCNITDYIAFAQFPVSTLPGLENSSTNPMTDGIIISNKVFGSSDYGNFNLDDSFNKGRTLTHEVGHFFGLRHTWGDETNCKGTDYVDDTPAQSEPTNGCPIEPFAQCPAENPRTVMFQNFLDLTDDECMNLFTHDQVNRMRIVLENSPRRASLLLPFSPSEENYLFDKLFSPNGDGVNDYWKWYNYNTYEGCKLTIFNRFGKKVYEMTSYDGSWDGRSSEGQPLEEEAYYFIIRCNGKDDLTGGVRIVR